MAGVLKVEGAKLLLKGGLLNGNRNIHAMRSATQTFTTAGDYEAIVMGLADWSLGADGTAKNTAKESWPTPTADLADPVGISLYNGANWLYHWTSLRANVDAPEAGADFAILADQLELTLKTSAAALTARGLQLAYSAGLVSGTRYMSMHSAEPGATGGSQHGESTEVLEATWEVVSTAQNSVHNASAITWMRQLTNLPEITWVALREGTTTNANVLWKKQLTTATDPVLGATPFIDDEAATISFTIG